MHNWYKHCTTVTGAAQSFSVLLVYWQCWLPISFGPICTTQFVHLLCHILLVKLPRQSSHCRADSVGVPPTHFRHYDAPWWGHQCTLAWVCTIFSNTSSSSGWRGSFMSTQVNCLVASSSLLFQCPGSQWFSLSLVRSYPLAYSWRLDKHFQCKGWVVLSAGSFCFDSHTRTP